MARKGVSGPRTPRIPFNRVLIWSLIVGLGNIRGSSGGSRLTLWPWLQGFPLELKARIWTRGWSTRGAPKQDWALGGSAAAYLHVGTGGSII